MFAIFQKQYTCTDISVTPLCEINSLSETYIKSIIEHVDVAILVRFFINWYQLNILKLVLTF